jgi:hypothetical protein
MRTLIYKRTHHGDPDPAGRFGIHDCMGRVRTWSFEAVIGVGGIGADPESHGLAGKVNWIGIGPLKADAPDKRGPIVTFDHFLFYCSDGPLFAELAPRLANRMYATNVRAVMNRLDARERREVDLLLTMAKGAPPSSGRDAAVSRSARAGRCGTQAAKPIKGCSS